MLKNFLSLFSLLFKSRDLLNDLEDDSENFTDDLYIQQALKKQVIFAPLFYFFFLVH